MGRERRTITLRNGILRSTAELFTYKPQSYLDSQRLKRDSLELVIGTLVNPHNPTHSEVVRDIHKCDSGLSKITPVNA